MGAEWFRINVVEQQGEVVSADWENGGAVCVEQVVAEFLVDELCDRLTINSLFS